MSGKPIQLDLCGVDCDIQPWHIVLFLALLMAAVICIVKAAK